jgi:hypothetical protein
MVNILEKAGTLQPIGLYSLMKARGKHLIVFFAAYIGSHRKDSGILSSRKLIHTFRFQLDF